MEEGNMAAIRKALVEIDELTNLLDIPEDKKNLLVSPSHSFIAVKIRRIIKKALEETPRNCDRFGGDFKMLHTAWFDWTGSPSGHNPDGTVKMAFGEWLLAPAIKKGGAK